MSKLLTTLLAAATAAAFAGASFADQQSTDPQRRDNQTQSQPNATQGKPEQSDAQAATDSTPGGASNSTQTGQSNDPVQHSQTENQANQAGAADGNMGRKPDQPGGQVSAQEQEYLADLKKCDSMSGAQKTNCVKAAKKRHGQM
jgi:hypothetical protein